MKIPVSYPGSVQEATRCEIHTELAQAPMLKVFDMDFYPTRNPVDHFHCESAGSTRRHR
jgi:hypothetical protein